MKKLKNRKSGIIGELHYSPDKEYCFTVVTEDPADIETYKTLEGLYNVWKDYIEPQKGKWYINENNEPEEIGFGFSLDELDSLKEIGLLFDTKEETERAVLKLKAWTRLKDLDTEILGWEIRDMPDGGNWQTVNVKLNIKARKEPMELLDLLFEGEE